MPKIRKAVITAAGWGTRFLPVTKSQPKEMLPLANKPLIQYSVEEAISCGVELVIIVTALGKRAIEDYFDRCFELEQVLEQRGEHRLVNEIRNLSRMTDIAYVHQKEQLGLGHALLCAKSLIGDEPFILILPDDIFEQGGLVLKKMVQVHQQYESSVIAVQRVAPDETSRYGIVAPRRVADLVHQVTDMVEKPRPGEAPSNLAIMGRYVLVPEILHILEDTLPGRNGEIQLTDALRRLAHERSIYAYEFEGERWDAGTPLGWIQTTIAMALRDPDLGPGLLSYLRGLLHPSAPNGGTLAMSQRFGHVPPEGRMEAAPNGLPSRVRFPGGGHTAG